jgi:hypothetical protein
LSVGAGAQFAHIDGHHPVGAHGPGDIGRHVVHGATVHQHLTVEVDGRKDQGEGHGGAHRRGQRAAVEHHRGGTDEVDGDGAKWCWEVVEPRQVVVGGRDPVEKQLDLLAVVERGRWGDTRAPQAELDSRRKGARIGLAPDVLEREVGRAEQFVPVDRSQKRVQLVRVHARGERAANQAAHAGACRNIDGNAMLLEPANHAHVPRGRGRCRPPNATADDGAPLGGGAVHACRRRSPAARATRPVGGTTTLAAPGRTSDERAQQHPCATANE